MAGGVRDGVDGDRVEFAAAGPFADALCGLPRVVCGAVGPWFQGGLIAHRGGQQPVRHTQRGSRQVAG